MPLYEYQCEACGSRFERIRKFSDPPIELCPNCGELKVKKLLSSPAIQFKGSGFYINDYARKDAGAPDGAKTDAAKASGGDGDGKAAPSESKSDNKSENKTSSSDSKSSDSSSASKSSGSTGSGPSTTSKDS